MYRFTYLQQYGYNVMMAGYNIFLTGNAGTGKSYLVNEFINDVTKLGRKVMVLAPTGIAAMHVNGVTIHRQFRIPTHPLVNFNIDKVDLDELEATDIVILEEVSMCRIDIFDVLCRLIMRVNSNRYSRRKIQLIVCGDFFQLPPVITEKEKPVLDKLYNKDIGSGFAFDSIYWDAFDFKNIILTEVVRQSNIAFVQALNKVRLGDKSGIDYIYDNSAPYELKNAITLCGTNKEADSINEKELAKIESEEIELLAEAYGDINLSDTNAEFILKIKLGARVMVLVNSNNFDYRNGSLGVITGIGPDAIRVKLDSGHSVMIERYTWETYRYEATDVGGKKVLSIEQVGSITQFPIKLAYAMTIHKSQGQTYDAVNLSPYCWDCGQLYVSLSRVRTLDRLFLKYEIDRRYLVVSLNVISFFNKIVKSANKTIDTSINVWASEQPKTVDMTDDMAFIFSKLSNI